MWGWSRPALAGLLWACVAWLPAAAGTVAVTGCDPGTSTDAPGARAAGRKDGTARAAIRIEDRTHRPKVAPADRYGEKPKHQLNAAEAFLLSGLDGLKVRHDPALSRMSRELAAAAPNRFNMPPGLVDGLLAWFGLFDPPPSVVVVEVADTDCTASVADSCKPAMLALLKEVRRTIPQGESVAVGVGATVLERNTSRIMITYLERGAVLKPLPISAAVGANLDLQGRLIGDRQLPRLEVIDAEGQEHDLPAVLGNDGSFRASIRCEFGRGIYQVEVLADGKFGPEVAANFPLYCGVRRPDAVDYQLEKMAPDATAAQVARENFRYLNAAREARGLPVLEWSSGAAAAARAHSEDMVANGFIGHVSPTTGDVARRFERAGIEGAVLRENVARGYGPKGIHQSLMHSPGHRVNILAADVTAVGIGVVVAPPETDAPGAARPIFLTQNFYRPLGAGVPDDVVGDVVTRVQQTRDRKGLSALTFDPRLSRLAQSEADAIARGKAPAAGNQEKVFDFGYAAVERHQVTANDHLGLPTVDLWLSPSDPRGYGLGISRIIRGDKKGYFVMVVFVAEKG